MSTAIRCRKCVTAGRQPPVMARVGGSGCVEVRTRRRGWKEIAGNVTKMGAPNAVAHIPEMRAHGVTRAWWTPIGGNGRWTTVCPMCGRKVQVTARMLRRLRDSSGGLDDIAL